MNEEGYSAGGGRGEGAVGGQRVGERLAVFTASGVFFTFLLELCHAS